MGERCKQQGCVNPAAHRFTWPGQDESFICENHVAKLRAVAAALGLHLQIIRLSTGATDEPAKESSDG